MSDYIKKSEADLLNEKERKRKKKKEKEKNKKKTKNILNGKRKKKQTKMSHYLIIQQCQN